jgi:deoxyhypusine synthase
MITAKVRAYGGMNTIRTSLGDFVTFEELECDIDYYLNGEALKRDGFKELYTKLFKNTTFEEFEESIESFCEDELKNKNANHIEHLNPKSRIKIIKELLANYSSFTHADGDTIITNYWSINEVLQTFGSDLLIEYKKYYISADDYRYGISYNEVIKAINKLQKKYDC